MWASGCKTCRLGFADSTSLAAAPHAALQEYGGGGGGGKGKSLAAIAAAEAARPVDKARETPQERIKRLMAAQLNKKIQKDSVSAAQKKLQVGFCCMLAYFCGSACCMLKLIKAGCRWVQSLYSCTLPTDGVLIHCHT